MKNKLTLYLFLLLAIITSLPKQSNAQYFAPVGAKWTYSRFIYMVPPSFFTGYVQLESIKDTNILGNNCKLIVETYENNSIQDSLYLFKDNLEKVFYFSSDSNRFCLLYDFNLLPGDSFELDCIADPNNLLKNLIVYVDSVKQISINGKNLKVQYYRASNIIYEFTGSVIENIGHLAHLFPTPTNYVKGPLRCYQDDSLGLYNPGAIANCNYVITGVDETKKELDGIKIYPTLVENKLFVINEQNKKINLTVTSILGEKKYFFRDFTPPKLDLSNLTTGIYFITIASHNNYMTTKIIKK